MSLACCFTCELSATANIHLDSCKVHAGGVFWARFFGVFCLIGCLHTLATKLTKLIKAGGKETDSKNILRPYRITDSKLVTKFIFEVTTGLA